MLWDYLFLFMEQKLSHLIITCLIQNKQYNIPLKLYIPLARSLELSQNMYIYITDDFIFLSCKKILYHALTLSFSAFEAEYFPS